MTLLSPGILNMAKKWLPRARLWKLIISQSTTGYWDASSTTALVLEARTAEEVEVLPKTLVKRILDLARSMTETVADAEAAGEGDDGIDGRHEQDDLDELFEFREEGEDEDDETPRVRRRSKRRPPTDCPVTCSVEAIVASIPRALTKLASDVPTAVKLRRVWTTMCCIAVLERLMVSWVWGDGDLYPPDERCVPYSCCCFVCVACSPRHAPPQHDRGRRARVDRGAGGGVARPGSRAGGRQVDEGGTQDDQVLEPRLGAARD